MYMIKMSIWGGEGSPGGQQCDGELLHIDIGDRNEPTSEHQLATQNDWSQNVVLYIFLGAT